MVRKMTPFMARYDLLLTPTLAVPPLAIHMQRPEKIDADAPDRSATTAAEILRAGATISSGRRSSRG